MSEAKIQIYKGPAGGWGALRSVARQLGVSKKQCYALSLGLQPEAP